MTRFSLTGDPIGLVMLCGPVSGRPVCSRGGRVYLLCGHQIDEAVEAGRSALPPARELLEVMNGAARLQDRGPDTPRLTGNSSQNPGGAAQATSHITARAKVEFNERLMDPREAQHAVELAERSEPAKAMLAFLAAPQDGDVGWFDLSKVLEMLEDQVGKKAFHKSWMKTAVQQRIERTA